MKTKLWQFYHTHIHPKLADLKARLATVKAGLDQRRQRLAAWLKRRRTGLLVAAGLVIALALGAGLAVLWLSFPGLQRAVRNGAAYVAGLVAAVATVLTRPFRSPAPVIITAQPAPLRTAAPVAQPNSSGGE